MLKFCFSLFFATAFLGAIGAFGVVGGGVVGGEESDSGAGESLPENAFSMIAFTIASSGSGSLDLDADLALAFGFFSS